MSRPVDAKAASGDLPISALLGTGMQQARIPGQRHNDRASVHQIHTQAVFGKTYVFYLFPPGLI